MLSPAVIPAAPVAGLSFHHLGVACRRLADETAWWATLGYTASGGVFRDANQGVEIQFLEGAGPRIELIAPLPGSTTLDPYLRSGSRLYHVGYSARDFDAAFAALKKSGRVASAPKPAVAFAGARVAFVLFRNLLLVELIESANP